MADEEVVLISFKMDSVVTIDWDADDIARSLSPMQALKMMIQVDQKIDEWEFTILAYRYFKNLIKTAERAVPHLLELDDLKLEQNLDDHWSDEQSADVTEEG